MEEAGRVLQDKGPDLKPKLRGCTFRRTALHHLGLIAWLSATLYLGSSFLSRLSVVILPNCRSRFSVASNKRLTSLRKSGTHGDPSILKFTLGQAGPQSELSSLETALNYAGC